MKMNGVALSNVYSYNAPKKQAFGAKLEIEPEVAKNLSKDIVELEGSRLMKKIEKTHPEQTIQVKYVPPTGGYAPLWGPVSHPAKIKLINQNTGKVTPDIPISGTKNTLGELFTTALAKPEFWQDKK